MRLWQSIALLSLCVFVGMETSCYQCRPESIPPEEALPVGEFRDLQVSARDVDINFTLDSVTFTTDTVIVRLTGSDGRMWRLTYALGDVL